MRKLTCCLFLCSIVHFTKAQPPSWDPIGNNYTTNAASVGIGTSSFSARLHIADGFGGEQLRLSRGTGSVRFTQSNNLDNLYLYNSDASKLFMFWRENGNVGIGTNNPAEKLTLAGNMLLNGAYKITFLDRLILQMPIGLENYYTRSIVSQNMTWNESTNKWNISDQVYPDFAMMRLENGGRVGFFNSSLSPAEITNANMETYRRFTIDGNGHIGIGTGSPVDLLTIDAGATRRGITIMSDGDGNAFTDLQFKIASNSSIPSSGAIHWIVSHRKDGYFSGAPYGQSSLEFYASNANGGYYAPLCFNSNGDIILASTKNAAAGNVLIGKTSQTNTSYKLDINGNVRANKIVVNTTGADFVFEEDYKLRKLEELQQYIRQHKHLPEVPSAKEMESEGLDIGDMNIKLLQKVEELTLYLIDVKKSIEQLQQENLELKKLLKNQSK